MMSVCAVSGVGGCGHTYNRPCSIRKGQLEVVEQGCHNGVMGGLGERAANEHKSYCTGLVPAIRTVLLQERINKHVRHAFQ